MHRQPTTISSDRLTEFHEEIGQFRNETDQYIEQLLKGVERREIRVLIKSIIFSANDALPKRNIRPLVTFPFIAKQHHLALKDRTTLDDFMAFTLAFLESSDIFDDMIDGDIAKNSILDVLIARQLLQPLLVRRLAALDSDAVTYWCEKTVHMWNSFVDEVGSEPNADDYMALVENQSYLFGVVTGVSAVASGVGAKARRRSEKLGKDYFKFDQFVLDAEQYVSGDSDPWNAWNLLPDDAAIEYLFEWQDSLETALEAMPDERAVRIRPLIALDIDSWNPHDNGS